MRMIGFKCVRIYSPQTSGKVCGREWMSQSESRSLSQFVQHITVYGDTHITRPLMYVPILPNDQLRDHVREHVCRSMRLETNVGEAYWEEDVFEFPQRVAQLELRHFTLLSYKVHRVMFRFVFKGIFKRAQHSDLTQSVNLYFLIFWGLPCGTQSWVAP